ncbi:class D sortase [Metabacillus sp. GX 13764]|uniref:class D sortase n=1 Tax=Metabacillus kandeliae TaxID=2900151 RepID=UPI001E54580C|nr:class D sortase [Metabacillus kandeliae]MCD7035863.1 class D sortase [Metabacillus kandeliae]
MGNSAGKKKRMLLLFAIAALLGGGIYLAGTNAFKLAYAYFLYKTEKPAPVMQPVPPRTSPVKTDEKQQLYTAVPKIGENMGELFIPKLKASLPIYHGTDEDELERGVGHYAGSVLPGEKDNSVLAGHRDTVFRRLGEVGKKDLLIVKTKAGTFTYKVRKVRIVDADDRTVIVPKPKATLTVSTCYPFRFIGPAPKRYVLVADLIGSQIKK